MRSIRLALMVTAWLTGACALTPATIAQTAPPPGNAAPTADNAVPAHDILQARPVAPAKRTQRAAREARLLQSLSAARRRGRELVRDDGDRTGGHAAAAGVAAARGQPHLRDTAWGSYHTEFYPTYDYKAVGIARAREGAIGEMRSPLFNRAESSAPKSHCRHARCRSRTRSELACPRSIGRAVVRNRRPSGNRANLAALIDYFNFRRICNNFILAVRL